MKYAQVLFAGVLLAVLFGGCGTSNPVVATVGNEKITLQDFEKNYAKNNGGWESAEKSSLDDRKRFLDLLVKFRLKLQEAKDRGLLDDSAVTGELNQYKASVSQSYMLEKELIDPHVKAMYDHKLEDIHAAHIFFRLPPNPTPADTLAAYNKALRVDSLLANVSFDSLARKYSEDPRTAPNGGDLGWILPDRTPEELTNAVYSLQEGEYSKVPFRSQFGYHIFKVLQREPSKGEIRISHILKRFSRDMKDTAAVSDTIRQIYHELKNGAKFADLARQYSDDPGSKERGGDIGFYQRENLRPDIADFLYSLKVDSVSEPYRQPYGYHIFMITDRRPVAPFSEMEKDLRSEYQQRYYQQDYNRYVDKLRNEYDVSVNADVEAGLRAAFDTTKTPSSSEWSDTLSPSFLSKTLFTYSDKPFTVKDFVDDAEANTDLKEMPLKRSNINLMVNRLADARVLRDYALKSIDRYPQLKTLMGEYLDGILIYRIEQDEVWKQVVVNDSLLRIFYDTTKQQFRFPNRVNFAEIYVTNDSVKKIVQQKLASGTDFLSTAEQYTARPGYRERLGIWGLQPYDLNELSRKAAHMKTDSISDFLQFQNGWSIIKMLGKDSSRVKTFEEAEPELASAFQELASKAREDEWLDSLKQKYGVTLNTAALSEAFEKKPIDSK